MVQHAARRLSHTCFSKREPRCENGAAHVVRRRAVALNDSELALRAPFRVYSAPVQGQLLRGSEGDRAVCACERSLVRAPRSSRFAVANVVGEVEDHYVLRPRLRVVHGTSRPGLRV